MFNFRLFLSVIIGRIILDTLVGSPMFADMRHFPLLSTLPFPATQLG